MINKQQLRQLFYLFLALTTIPVLTGCKLEANVDEYICDLSKPIDELWEELPKSDLYFSVQTEDGTDLVGENAYFELSFESADGLTTYIIVQGEIPISPVGSGMLPIPNAFLAKPLKKEGLSAGDSIDLQLAVRVDGYKRVTEIITVQAKEWKNACLGKSILGIDDVSFDLFLEIKPDNPCLNTKSLVLQPNPGTVAQAESGGVCAILYNDDVEEVQFQ